MKAMARRVVEVVLGVVLLAVAVACDEESTALPSERESKDAAYVAMVMEWFERIDVGDIHEVIDRGMLTELRDIEISSLSRHGHRRGLLLDAYALRVEAEERMQALEPSEEARWVSLGADESPRCIQPSDVYGGGRFSLSYGSEEFEFACTVRRHAQSLWQRASAEWLVGIVEA